jgi:hypothetical protein
MGDAGKKLSPYFARLGMKHPCRFGESRGNIEHAKMDGKFAMHGGQNIYICVLSGSPSKNPPEQTLSLSFHHPNSVQEKAKPCTTLQSLR